MITPGKGRMRLCICLITANLLFIWGNSLLPASVSGAISHWVRNLMWFLPSTEGDALSGDGVLRKIAHLLEFCCLGILLSWLCGMLRQRKWGFLWPTIGCGCLTACIDEMLQYFAPGRSPQLSDVAIDLSGVVLGIILFLTGYLINKKKNLYNNGGK